MRQGFSLIPVMVLLCMASLFWGCSDDGFAGATSETTNGYMSATVIDDEGEFVSQANVYLRTFDSLSSMESRDTAITQTDEKGFFELFKVKPSDYIIEIQNSVGQSVQLESHYNATTEKQYLPDFAVVQRTGSISGKIHWNDSRQRDTLFVQLYGLGRVTIPDSLDNFFFQDVPRGRVRLHIITKRDSVIVDKDELWVNAGVTAKVTPYSIGVIPEAYMGAVVLYEDSSVAKGAEIFLRKTDSLCPLECSEESNIETNRFGKFEFFDCDTTNYLVEVRTTDGYGIQYEALYKEKKHLLPDTLILQKHGALKGQIQWNDQFHKTNVLLQVHGLGRTLEPNGDGSFLFDDLPIGKVSLHIINEFDSVLIESKEFDVISEDTTDAGVYEIGDSFTEDTLIVRNILTLNGLHDINMWHVITRDTETNTVKVLNLDERGIHTIPDEIGRLNLKKLSLARNNLKTIPAIVGSFSHLVYLDISNNAIKELPASLGNLDECTYLDMGYNDVSSLPDALREMENLYAVYINGNKLHNLSQDDQKWIDEHSIDSSWRDSQR